MKHLDSFEKFTSSKSLNEGLKGTELTQEEADAIFTTIKDFAKDPSTDNANVSAYNKADVEQNAGDFGKNPDSKKFKMHSIYATSFSILVSITTQDNKVVCYVTMSYNTTKKVKLKSKENSYVSFVDRNNPTNFNMKVKPYKVNVWH